MQETLSGCGNWGQTWSSPQATKIGGENPKRAQNLRSWGAGFVATAFERTWHTNASTGRILAVAFR